MSFVKVTEDLGDGKTRTKIVVSSKLEKIMNEVSGNMSPFRYFDLSSFKMQSSKVTIVNEKKIIPHYFIVKEKVKLGRI